jgi:hypothetical protein
MEKDLIYQADIEKLLLKYIEKHRPQSFASLYYNYIKLCNRINESPLKEIVGFFVENNCERFGFER